VTNTTAGSTLPQFRANALGKTRIIPAMFETLSPYRISGKPILADTRTSAEPFLEAMRQPDLMVPIRSLGENHRTRIEEHLLTLSSQDRYFRFGFSAKDEQVKAYVAGLNFERDEIFGIYNSRLKLIAMAHLAYSSETRACASSEFGVSVLEPVRGRGYGRRLFERAVMHARNEGVTAMYVHVLSENTAMLKIARRAGATVVRDGAESEAHLSLTPPTFHTQMSEIMEEHLALANYHFKAQAKQFWDTFSRMQQAWIPVKQEAEID